jgi:EmrB/QacA subfamily drug resistance transporter
MDRKWWTLIAVCVATFMLLLDVTIVNVALPAIQTSLKASFTDLQWVVDAYALMLAALLLTTGSLADLFGRRRVFVLGLLVFTASSLLSGLATSPLWLNLARGAQGVGGAAMFSTSLALLGSAFQGRERGLAFGAWGAITGLAVAVGPVVGGALTSGLSWRWIFLVNVPIGAVAVLLGLLRVQESRQPGAHRPDFVGAATFSGALGALVFALIKGESKGWTSTVIVACLTSSVVLLATFVIAERLQGERAMFDLALFRKPTFTGGSIAAFALSAGLFALLLYLTLYLQNVLGFSALHTGLRLLVLSGGILLTSTLAGRLTAVVPIRLLIAPGLALVGAGLLLMRGLSPSSGWTHLIPGFIVAGAGTGLINPPLASTAIGVVEPHRAGMASGINSTFRQVGIATGIAGLGSVFSHTVRTQILALLDHVAAIGPTRAHALAAGVAQGNGVGAGLARLPATARPAAVHAVRVAFVTGLNRVLLIGAALAFVSAVLTFVLIREQDFAASAARQRRGPWPPDGSGGSGPPAGAVEPDRVVERAGAPQGELERQGAAATGAAAAPAALGETAHALRHAPSAAAGTPAPGAQALADGNRDLELLRRAEALAVAAEQAAADYRQQIEVQIERHRAEELAAASRQARRLHEQALARSDEYAASLRGRLQALIEERDRLLGQLREHLAVAVRDPGGHGEGRAELYRVIAALGELGGQGLAGSGRPPEAPGG